MTELQTLLDTGRHALRLARGLISSSRVFDIQPKGDRDMVSNVDQLIEQRVREFLFRKAPHIGFIGEEEAPGSLSEYNWVLDPIDGTANYVRGIPLYSVALSLLHEESTVLGLIDLPYFDQSYSAIRGSGAFLDGTPTYCSRTAKLSDAIVAISDFSVEDKPEAENALLLRIADELSKRVQRVRLIGSAAISLAWVADGRFDAVVILSNKPWDTSAGMLIANEAGAATSDVFGVLHTLESGSAVAVTQELEYDLISLLADATES